MPTLTERIESDYKMAFKAGERLKVDVLRMIKADLQRLAIDKRATELADQDVIQIVSKQTKQRQETIDAARKGGRADVAAQTEQELAILKTYLPAALSAQALSRLIEEAVQAVGSSQGQIMKYVM